MTNKDVFISYARASATEPAQKLLEKLEKAGVPTYIETEEIPVGAPFPKHLADALKASRLVVIFADSTYFSRPWCVYEFLVTIAPYRQNPNVERVLDHVIIAIGEATDSILPHLPPPLAQGAWPAFTDTEALAQLVIDRGKTNAMRLEERLAGLDDAVVNSLAGGGAIPRTRSLAGAEGKKEIIGPRYLQNLPDSLGEGFFGRRKELWELFHVLETRRAGGSPASCLVEGVDGLGKTQLVAEYVWRYGHYYPGGIVWLDASDELDQDRQLGEIKTLFAKGRSENFEVIIQQAAAQGQILWVVDQLPEPEPGQRPKSLTNWCPAHQHVTVLATSQRTGVRELDEHVRLDELDVEDAVSMLTRKPVNANAIDHFGWTDLAYWVGRMPLALEILHETLAEGLANAEDLLAKARSDDPAPQLDEEMTILAEDLPSGTLRGIYETFRLTYAKLSGKPEMLRAAHRFAWLRAAPMREPWINSLVDAGNRTLLAKRSWLDYRPGQQGEQASWRMHRIVGSFLRNCSPDPDGELVEVFEWLRKACLDASSDEAFQLDRHASTLYGRVFALAERVDPAKLKCIQAAADAAAQLVIMQLENFERRGTRYLSAQFLRNVGAGPSLVNLLRNQYNQGNEAQAKSIAALIGALPGVREAAEFCAEILSDTRDAVRWQAFLSATSLGFADVLGVPYVDSLMKEANENVRQNMQAGFQNMFLPDGDGLGPVLECLTAYLKSDAKAERTLAAALIGQLYQAYPEAVKNSPEDPAASLRRTALNDPDQVTGETAARQLAMAGDNELYSLLVERLSVTEGNHTTAAVRLCVYLNALETLPAPQVEMVDRDEGMELRGNFFPKAGQADPELYGPLKAILIKNDEPNLVHEILVHMTSHTAKKVLVDLALGFLDNKQYERLLQFADQVAAAQENFPSVPWWRGQAYEALGRNEEAIAAYTETLRITPQFYEAAMRRGIILHESARSEEALKDLQNVVENDPQWDGAWYYRGAILLNLGKNDEALASIDRALELAPDAAEYYYWRSHACQRLGYWDEAAQAINEALKRNPQDQRYLELEQWLKEHKPADG